LLGFFLKSALFSKRGGSKPVRLSKKRRFFEAKRTKKQSFFEEPKGFNSPQKASLHSTPKVKRGKPTAYKKAKKRKHA
jgi:hypothetical protein